MTELKDPRFILSMTVIFIAALYDLCVSFLHPTADPNLIGMILGVLNGGGFAAAVQFWIGSSASSKEKDTAIANLSAK
jgi:hypothetical protein